MAKIDFKALNSDLLSRRAFVDWLPAGYEQGVNWCVGSVGGEAGQSLRVNMRDGGWKDYADGSKGGDLISLYAAIKGVLSIDAARELSGAAAIPAISAKPRPAVKAKPDVVLSLPPEDAEWPDFKSASGVWTYRNGLGHVLFHIARYDTADGKQFKPFSWDGVKWICKAWPEMRPLYGLEFLGDDRPVLVVEGEKACDAARLFAGKAYAVVTWSGGAKAWQVSDWSVLAGRKVLLWPDADNSHEAKTKSQADEAGVKIGELLPYDFQPGPRAMNELANRLKDHCHEVKILDVSDIDHDGFDAADSAFDWKAFVTWAKPRASLCVHNTPKYMHKDDAGAEYPKLDKAEPENIQSKITPPPVTTTVVSPPPAGLKPIDRQNLLQVLPHWSGANNNPKPLGTIENLVALLDYVGVILRYNVVSKQEEILIPGQSNTIDNGANACLARILSLMTQAGMPTAHHKDYITQISDSRLYNPVATWILSKPWDGTSRLHDLYSTIVAKDEKSDPVVASLKKTLIRRWMVSAVAGAFSPKGVSAHGVLVLQGEQYIGKTAWVKSLAPRDLDVIADGKILKPDDKDSVNQIVRYWIVELGELDATFRKADIAQLKAFITKDSDLFRRAYAAKESAFARRTVFFASVNQAEFLHDETGNRRFWTIECESINHDHGLDMQQIWAEVHALYVDGESWFLSKPEMEALNRHNESFMSKDPVEEMIETLLDWESNDANWSYCTATDVLISLGLKNPNTGQKKKASQELFKKNGGRKKKSNGHRMLLVPRTLLKVVEIEVNGAPNPDKPHFRKRW